MKYLFALSLFLAGAATSSAQLLSHKTLALDGARKILAEAIRYANEIHAPGGAIAIVDAGGHLICLERLDGTFAAASEVATQKANTAACFKAPTAKLENAINGGRQALITVGHTFLQGGIPIIIDGEVVGAIGVSGSASAQQDEDIAIAASHIQF